MKVVLALFAVAVTVAHSSIVQFLPAPRAFVRTPALDSAVIQSERSNGAFSYSTVENHAYQSVPVVRTYSYIPQVPQVYYAAPSAVYSFHPSYPASYIPSFSGIPLAAPGFEINPQNPVEVESPADNSPNDDLKQGNGNNDDDSVSVESD